MLFVLSPAKKLDYDTPLAIKKHTQPLFVPQAAELIKILKTKSVEDISTLMSLSPALSALNVNRYADWTPTFDQYNSRQALFAFNGDVYEGLEALTLNASQVDWAQEHIAILSGLYGVLRPLDLMQPYRLEMGTRLENAKGKNLYAFWSSQIAAYFNARLQEQKSKVLVNLASEEYFKSVDLKTLDARVVQCVFQEYKNGVYKIISFNAKRARGLMARFAIETKAQKPEDLQLFDKEDYRFDPEVSNPDKLVFRRKR